MGVFELSSSVGGVRRSEGVELFSSVGGFELVGSVWEFEL